MLFFERQASSLAGGGVVSRIEENDSPSSLEGLAVKDLAVFIFQSETWGLLSYDVDAHHQPSVGRMCPIRAPFVCM